MKLMNAISSGNIYGAFQTFNNLKGTKEFVNHVNSKNTDTLFVIGADPVGDSIYSTKIKEIISDVQNVISIDMFLHETSELANCVIPTSATLVKMLVRLPILSSEHLELINWFLLQERLWETGSLFLIY